MRTRGLEAVLGAIVASCSQPQQQPVDAGGEAAADATIALDSGGGDVAAKDAPIDSYVVWCEAGAPQQLGDGGCYNYYYVPCGLPAGDVTDDAGVINRCDQLCTGAFADDCALLPAQWIDVFLDAGLIDAGMASAVDGGAVFVLCACQTAGGRRPAGFRPSAAPAPNALAAYFAQLAHLERASVPAFERLRAELGALGAPRGLLAAATRAARDERRHARRMEALTRRFGGSLQRTAHRVPTRPRSIEAVARENVVEGCVRETFGALVATWQARHARDAEVARAMASIARDETRHAELAWSVSRFLDAKLDRHARARVARARACAHAELVAGAGTQSHPSLVREAGVPSSNDARRLVAALGDYDAATSCAETPSCRLAAHR
jgi:hypothetical protein